jgi:glycine/D-amino acid oxidase-like deaminating enzyme
MLPRKADVVVIGAGVIGTSITYYLAKRKIDVVLLDKGGIASGTSSSCDGSILLQAKKPGIHLRIALESASKFSELTQELDFNIEYRKNGGIIVITNREELTAMENFVKEQKKAGLEITLLNQSQTLEREPELSKEIVGSSYSPHDAQVNPIYLTYAFTEAAKRFGAKVFTHTKVLDIKTESNRIVAVSTNKCDIYTSIVVNACGVYAPEIGKMVNIDIPIQPRRGQILVTEVIPKLLNSSVVNSAGYIAVKFNPDLLNDPRFQIINTSLDPSENGNILIGSTREFVGFNKSVTHEGICKMARDNLKIVPKLKNVHIIRVFAGLRPYTPDGLPILGKVKALEGFILAAGHEGDGIALSPITGDLISELILKGKTHIPIDDFCLERFYKDGKNKD